MKQPQARVVEALRLRQTMMNLATLTGGRAYYNRNDLQGAIRDGVDSGSNYYILAYLTP